MRGTLLATFLNCMTSTKLKGECFFSSLHLTSQMSLLLHLIEPDWLQRSRHCYQLNVPFARIHGNTGDSFQQHCVDKYSKTRFVVLDFSITKICYLCTFVDCKG